MMAVVTWLAYRRVSRVGGREHLISPEMQAQRIMAYADGRGLEVEMLEPELDVSGAKVRRPILEQALERIDRGEAEGIIVATLDRLSRMSMSDALRTIERIEAGGGQVIAVAENFDASTPEGRMVRNIHLSIGAAGRERSAEHLAGAKRRAVEHGIWPVSTIPRGYAKGHDRRLIPGEDAAAVKRAFQLRAGGAPWSRVAEELGSGVSGAAKTIKNRVYLGHVELRIGDEHLVNPDAHEPLISRDLWEAAQIAHPAPARSGHVALLAGIVRCASCSRLMSPGDKGYRCFPRAATGDCPAPATISAALLEPHVEELALRELRRMQAIGHAPSTAAVERQALDDAEDELSMWREAVKISEVGPEFVAVELQRLAGNVERAREALGRAQAAAQAVEADLTAVEAYESLSVLGRRHVLRSAIGVVWVWKGRGIDGRVKVIAAGSEPPNLSRPGRPSPPVSVEWADLPGEVGPL